MQTHYKQIVLVVLLTLVISSFVFAQQPPPPEEIPQSGDIEVSTDDVQQLIGLFNNLVFKQADQKRAEAEKKTADMAVSNADLIYQNSLLKLRSKLKVDDDYQMKTNNKQIWFHLKPKPKPDAESEKQK